MVLVSQGNFALPKFLFESIPQLAIVSNLNFFLREPDPNRFARSFQAFYSFLACVHNSLYSHYKLPLMLQHVRELRRVVRQLQVLPLMRAIALLSLLFQHLHKVAYKSYSPWHTSPHLEMRLTLQEFSLMN